MKTKHIFIIRHGQTSFNVDGRILGVSNPSLNEMGVKQTGDLANKFKQKTICPQIIYSSPTKRTIQTAKIIQKNIGGVIKQSRLLKEIDYGEYEGMSNKVLRTIQFGYDSSKMLKGNAETVNEVEKRAKKFLTKLLKSKEEYILIITHAFTASVLIQLMKGLPRSFQTIQSLTTANYKYFKVRKEVEYTNERTIYRD